MLSSFELTKKNKSQYNQILTASSLIRTNSDESVFKQIANNLKDLNDNIINFFENIKSVFDFFGKVGYFFREASYWIVHPGQLLDLFQPWLITGLMVMIILKMLGFNTDKWFRLCFLLFMLSIIF